VSTYKTGPGKERTIVFAAPATNAGCPIQALFLGLSGIVALNVRLPLAMPGQGNKKHDSHPDSKAQWQSGSGKLRAIIPLKPKNGLTRISCTRHQATAACAAFIEESRMKFLNATHFTGNPGEWGIQRLLAE
jgi:hypothetical protein